MPIILRNKIVKLLAVTRKMKNRIANYGERMRIIDIDKDKILVEEIYPRPYSVWLNKDEWEETEND